MRSENMDYERYKRDPGYRAQVEGGRKGGRSRSRKKVESSRRNVAKSRGRPRKDGMPPGWETEGLTPPEAAKRADETETRKWVAWTRTVLNAWEVEIETGMDADVETVMARMFPDETEARDEFRAWCGRGKPAGGISKHAYRLLTRARLKQWRDRRREVESFPI